MRIFPSKAARYTRVNRRTAIFLRNQRKRRAAGGTTPPDGGGSELGSEILGQGGVSFLGQGGVEIIGL